jgi:hypothetical protein
MSIEVIRDVFKKINSTSYGLNAMEIDNARYGGEFKISERSFQDMIFLNTIKYLHHLTLKE